MGMYKMYCKPAVIFVLSPPPFFMHGQIPENSIGKALRSLHERLSSDITDDVHVGTDGVVTSEVSSESLLANGLHSTAVVLGCDGLSLSTVESNGILINSHT